MPVASKSCVASDRDALTDVGVCPIDRTAILRTAALGGDTANLQSIETRALLGRAEWTLEAMATGRPNLLPSLTREG